MNPVIALILILGLAACGLWLWSLIHCITNKRLSDANRIVGIVCILLLGFLGSLIYLFLPRLSVRRGRGTARMLRGRKPPARPVAGATVRGRTGGYPMRHAR